MPSNMQLINGPLKTDNGEAGVMERPYFPSHNLSLLLCPRLFFLHILTYRNVRKYCLRFLTRFLTFFKLKENKKAAFLAKNKDQNIRLVFFNY